METDPQDSQYSLGQAMTTEEPCNGDRPTGQSIFLGSGHDYRGTL